MKRPLFVLGLVVAGWTMIGIPAYAIDEQSAVKVVDGSVEVVSEGRWTKFGC